MGRPEENLLEAARLLGREPCVLELVLSSVWHTEPVGFTDQNWFANQAGRVLVAPGTGPQAFLRAILAIEQKMGRKRELRWGPRIIDIDLLLFADQSMISPELVVPHPEMSRRAFVLIPLLELDPDIETPEGERAKELLARLDYQVDGDRIYQK